MSVRGLRQRVINLWEVAVIAGIALIAVYLYFYDPTTSPALKCPIKLLTGLDCPSCGIQRAAHALLHGDISQAVRYNYFLVLAVPFAAMYVIHGYLLSGKTRDRLGRILYSRGVLLGYVAVFIAWFVARNIIGI